MLEHIENVNGSLDVLSSSEKDIELALEKMTLKRRLGTARCVLFHFSNVVYVICSFTYDFVSIFKLY